MRLYRGRVPVIAQEIVRDLVSTQAIEAEHPAEVEKDVEAVLGEYLRMERDITEQAKNRLEARGLGHSELHRARTQVAKEKRVAVGDDALPYLLNQTLQMLFHSANVEEIYADDADLRQRITAILRKHMDVEEELQEEVRARLKNLEEGTATFEVEYQRVMNDIKQRKRLE